MFFAGFGRHARRQEVATNLDHFETKRVEKKKHVEKSVAGKGAVEEQKEVSALDMQRARSRFDKKKEEATTDHNVLLKKTTRKKFGLELIEDIVPEDLLCEECIAAYSTVFCSGCQQVLCPYCADICHPRIDVNTLHPHEVGKLIRPIRAGDTSSAVIEKPFPIPSFYIEESDYEQATGRPIERPNALAINLRDNHPVPSTEPYLAPKYHVDEKLIFIDPVTRQESFGRVISEWDLRHGCAAAPSIRRGDGSGVWYMIEVLGLLSEIGNIDELIKMIHAKPPPPILPEFADDVQSIPYREEFNHAREVNAQIQAVRDIQQLGPRRHYKPELLYVQPRGAEELMDQASVGGGGGSGGGGGFGGDDSTADDGQQSLSNESWGWGGPSPTQQQQQRQPEKTKAQEAEELALIPVSPREASQRSFHDALHHPIEIGPGAKSMQAQLLQTRGPTKNAREATMREAQRLQRMLSVVLLPETALTRAEDLIQDADAAKDTNAQQRALRRVLRRTFRRLQLRGFSRWVEQRAHLLVVKQNVMARTIQKYARRWLCRGCLDVVQREWEEELHRRWQKVHSQFRYSPAVHGGSRTLDKRLFFETTLDTNRYAQFLRLICGKIFSFMQRKYSILVANAMRKWKTGVLDFSEGALKVGHFVHETADLDADEVRSVEAVQSEALELFHKFQAKGKRAVSLDDGVYVNVSTMQLGLSRVTGPESATALPPYHPSLGIKLPPAVAVYLPEDANKRLNASQDVRLRHGAYRAHMQGPTDDSCWAIPGRVAMGQIPCNLATKRQTMPGITALLLAGVSTFVSLMEEDEEEAVCARQNMAAPIASMIKKCATGASFAVGQIVQDCNNTIETYSEKLAGILDLKPNHPDYVETNRERARCAGRIKLAKAKAAAARQQLEKFPKAYEWLRIPLKRDAAPTLNDALPVLWELERRLGEGQNLFLYSHEGHGRVGMIAGCLVGRLYGFKPTETLTRIQQSHDCMKSQERLPVPINCPQLPAQRALVTAVCLHTNKPYQGVTWRSHSDPEHRTDETHRPKPGYGKGVPLTHTTGIPTLGEAPLMAEEVDTAVLRTKLSLAHEIRLERDVQRPPPSTAGRDCLPAPDLPLLFSRYGQEQDVVREPRLLNHGNGLGGPAARPALPLLRVKNGSL